MAIGLGYYFAEQLIVALFSNLFSWFQNVADFFLVRNISGWTGGSGGLAGGALPDQTHAVVVLAVYTLVLGGVAFWLFERRDVQGATGGG
jgi:ABC-type transport system involved in multi-copper enzyme maturation permease subunit